MEAWEWSERMLAALVMASEKARANALDAAQGLFTIIIAISVEQANPDEEPHRLESRVRENRTHGSEGGDGESRSRPLSTTDHKVRH
jgi:hypothetical protein